MGKQIQRDLLCLLTEDEKAEVAHDLAKNIQEYNDLEAEAKQVAQDYRERLKLLDTLQRKMAQEVDTGMQERPVVCEWDYHSPENGQMRLIRQDTFEMVEVREMLDRDHEAYAAEMQTELKFDQ